MSTATDQPLDVEITVTDTAPCAKRLSLTVPAAEVDARLELAFTAFIADAALPGVRKGKAPRALVEKAQHRRLAHAAIQLKRLGRKPRP